MSQPDFFEPQFYSLSNGHNDSFSFSGCVRTENEMNPVLLMKEMIFSSLGVILSNEFPVIFFPSLSQSLSSFVTPLIG